MEINMIARPSYLEKLIRVKGNGFPKVINGLRRSGKSYLLNKIYRDYLLASGVAPESIISFSLNKKKDVKTLCGRNGNPVFVSIC